ncbi:MAG: BREX-1 system adenine-specific DNA-methyltransferase PglX, partial [Anaerolinea sp.]|nr:BREX-1 system adenine-specific DNA-methyltransferase PglX [Anaerolinea sp.]
TEYLNFINFWRERLAQQIIARLDRNPWALRPDGSIDVHVLRDAVQRFLDRLVIVRFAEDHLVIPPGTLYRMHELRRDSIYAFHLEAQILNLFREFDRRHNSALFRASTVDYICFGDKDESDRLLSELIEKLYQARYRAMPADILGNTYEQYLGKALAVDGRVVSTYDNLETRKKQGSYYTPQVIVQYLVDQTLGRYLYGTEDGRPDGTPMPGQTRKTAAEIRDLRVLDAACGSGSFLIYAYYVLADFYERERARLNAERRVRAEQFARDGLNEIDILELNAPLRMQMEALEDYPRLILERHLYGVDLDPQAAEIAVVNLMMRALEKQERRKRLPLILNQNVKVGSSLVGLLADDPALTAHRAEIAELRRLRLLLTDPAHDADHDRLLDALEAVRARLYAALNP